MSAEDVGANLANGVIDDEVVAFLIQHLYADRPSFDQWYRDRYSDDAGEAQR